jgi:hypothetical protein
MRRAGLMALLLAAVSALSIAPLRAQWGAPPEVSYQNTPYNARFTFARLRFRPSQWGPGQYMWGLDLKWNHDYPRGETHFLKILKETTSIETNPMSNIVAVDDPELFNYPVAYLCEPGFWTMDEKETQALRRYLLKGGFLIFDDFAGRDLDNLVEQLRKVLPSGRLVEIDATHAIFDSFFKIEALPAMHPLPQYYRFGAARYYGIFEDNDPKKRLLLIANYNNDISEYWEFSDEGWLPIELSNEAYKLGVNYVVYGMTH